MATGRIGTTPVLQVRWSKAPSAGTTSLSGLDDNSVSLVYSVGYEAVYRNGVLLSRTNDYTATDGTTITLIDATIAGDIIEVFANQTIPLADTYSQTVANGKFINNTLTTTTGDIIYASAANTPARLGIGSTGNVLTVSGGVPAWSAPAGGGYTQLATSTPSSATTVSFTSISGSYKHLLVTWSELYNDSHGGHGWGVRLNNDSASNYAMAGIRFNFSSPTKQAQAENYTAESMFYGDYVMAPIGNASNSQWNKTANGFFMIYDYANTSYKKVVNWGAYNWNNSDSGINAPVMINGIYNSNSAITRLDFIRSSSQTLNGGIIRLYGVS